MLVNFIILFTLIIQWTLFCLNKIFLIQTLKWIFDFIFFLFLFFWIRSFRRFSHLLVFLKWLNFFFKLQVRFVHNYISEAFINKIDLKIVFRICENILTLEILFFIFICISNRFILYLCFFYFFINFLINF